MLRLHRTGLTPATAGLALLATLLAVAGCSDRAGDIEGTWHSEDGDGTTLVIGDGQFRATRGPMQLSAAYEPVRAEGDRVTVRLTFDGRDLGEVGVTFEADDAAIRVDGKSPFAGRWLREKPSAERASADDDDADGEGSEASAAPGVAEAVAQLQAEIDRRWAPDGDGLVSQFEVVTEPRTMYSDEKRATVVWQARPAQVQGRAARAVGGRAAERRGVRRPGHVRADGRPRPPGRLGGVVELGRGVAVGDREEAGRPVEVRRLAAAGRAVDGRPQRRLPRRREADARLTGAPPAPASLTEPRQRRRRPLDPRVFRPSLSRRSHELRDRNRPR